MRQVYTRECISGFTPVDLQHFMLEESLTTVHIEITLNSKSCLWSSLLDFRIGCNVNINRHGDGEGRGGVRKWQ